MPLYSEEATPLWCSSKMGRDAKIHTHVPMGPRNDISEINICSACRKKLGSGVNATACGLMPGFLSLCCGLRIINYEAHLMIKFNTSNSIVYCHVNTVGIYLSANQVKKRKKGNHTQEHTVHKGQSYGQSFKPVKSCRDLVLLQLPIKFLVQSI